MLRGNLYLVAKVTFEYPSSTSRTLEGHKRSGNNSITRDRMFSDCIENYSGLFVLTLQSSEAENEKRDVQIRKWLKGEVYFDASP